MSVTILRIAAAVYALGALAYIASFVRRSPRLSSLGYALVAVALVTHAVSIGFGCKEWGGGEFFTMRGGFGFLAFLAAAAFLALLRFWKVPSVGAFLLPLVLAALVPGVLELGPDPALVPREAQGPELTLHVTTAGGGVALFGFAFAVAVMYLLQEREMKAKRFGVFFTRLPSLDTLDRLTQRLVWAGFGVFTVALVSGALMARARWGSFWTWDPQQTVSLAVWLLYAVMVQLRRSGMHGRHYAWLTLAGFALLLGSWVTLGVLVPQLTRHQGSFR